MSMWLQNSGQVWPRNGTAPTKDFYPLSVTEQVAQPPAPFAANQFRVAAW